ncbi:hypothetical protein D3C80_1928580 [compost metagenome]
MVELADLDGRAAQDAALGGVGVYVVEMLEVGGVAGGFVVDGEGVAGSGLDRKAHARKYKPPQYLWERVYPRMRRSRQRGCLVWPLRG